jgi:hypothetical protein
MLTSILTCATLPTFVLTAQPQYFFAVSEHDEKNRKNTLYHILMVYLTKPHFVVVVRGNHLTGDG